MLELELRGLWNWKAQAQIRPKKHPRKYKLSKPGIEIFFKMEELHNTIEYYSKSRLQPTTLAINTPTYEVDKNNKATMHNNLAQNQ